MFRHNVEFPLSVQKCNMSTKKSFLIVNPQNITKMKIFSAMHCEKSVRIPSYSGPYFP